MNQEIWKSVDGYEGFYEVSSHGRVKSLKRTVPCESSYSGFINLKEKILKPSTDKVGRRTVVLSIKNKRQTKHVHKLVAVAFLDHKPNGYELVVDHIDFNPSNNNVSNLRLVTPRKNGDKMHLPSTSKYKNVHWSSRCNKWATRMTINGMSVHLGYFNCEENANVFCRKAEDNLGLYKGNNLEFRKTIKSLLEK